jgi:flagella basal body P-ring formation protein FlgA
MRTDRTVTARKLTRRYLGCRLSGGFQKGCGILAILMSTISAPDSVAAEIAWQSPAEIRAAAEEYLRARTGATARHTSVRAALDARHRLPRCDRELEPFLRRGSKIDARTIVGVRCSGSKPWKVYVPVDVIVTAPVLTAARTLPSGHLLAAEDLATDVRDVSRMISGYFSDPQDLSGLRLKHQLIAGRVLTPAMLEADRVVRRGQSVTLTATSGGIHITMAGEALMDGARNQRIRVENLSSGRIIEGIVRSPEHVEVIVSGLDNLGTDLIIPPEPLHDPAGL